MRRLPIWFVLASVSVLATVLAYFLANPRLARQEQYLVYSSYIKSGLTAESHSLGDPGGLVVIFANATLSAGQNKFQQLRFLLGSLPNLRRNPTFIRYPLLSGLMLASLGNHPFERSFKLPAKYELTSSTELWSADFQKRFPGNYGILTFSSISFNRDLTEALFYSEHLCGLCGGGEFVFMRKVQGEWIVEGRSSTWIS